MDENRLRMYIQKVIFEGEEGAPSKPPESRSEAKPRKKKTDTAPGEIGVTAGRGRWSKSVTDAGALAEEAPDELMDNLNIKSAGDVPSILKQALKGSDVMKKSYGGLSNVTSGNMTGIVITMGELDSRNGAKYLHHTLIGAKNAGKLSLDYPLQIDRLDTGSVVIYKSANRNSWPASNKKKK